MDLEQMIEQRVCALEKEFEAPPFVGWMPARERFRRIARAELEREGRLVEAMRSGSYNRCMDAVVAYEAEFAPPQRTVEQIARDVDKARVDDSSPALSVAYQVVPKKLLDELAAALGKETR